MDENKHFCFYCKHRTGLKCKYADFREFGIRYASQLKNWGMECDSFKINSVKANFIFR